MKKIIILSSAVIFSSTIFAANSPFSPGPSPTQDYHAVNSNNSSSPVITAPAPATSTPTDTAITTTSKPSVSSGAAMLNSAGVDVSLEDQVTMLSQASMAFEQETDQHIQNLISSNQALSAQLQTTTQNIAELQQAVTQLESHQGLKPLSKNIFHQLNHAQLLVFIEFGGAAAFLLLLGVLTGRLTRRRMPTPVMINSPKNTAQTDDKGDYDFMNTAEAIPAKIDLARSYLMMGDIDQAKTILKNVIEMGNDQYTREAETMLNKIKNIAE